MAGRAAGVKRAGVGGAEPAGVGGSRSGSKPAHTKNRQGRVAREARIGRRALAEPEHGTARVSTIRECRHVPHRPGGGPVHAFGPRGDPLTRGSRWRRGWDSNPRSLSTLRFSRAPPSTARPPLRAQDTRPPTAVRFRAASGTSPRPSRTPRRACGVLAKGRQLDDHERGTGSHPVRPARASPPMVPVGVRQIENSNRVRRGRSARHGDRDRPTYPGERVRGW